MPSSSSRSPARPLAGLGTSARKEPATQLNISPPAQAISDSDWHDRIPAVLAAARPEDVLRHHREDLAAHSAARLPRTTAIARKAVKIGRLTMTSNRALMAVPTPRSPGRRTIPGLFLRSFEDLADRRPQQQPYASDVTPAGNR